MASPKNREDHASRVSAGRGSCHSIWVGAAGLKGPVVRGGQSYWVVNRNDQQSLQVMSELLDRDVDRLEEQDKLDRLRERAVVP